MDEKTHSDLVAATEQLKATIGQFASRDVLLALAHNLWRDGLSPLGRRSMQSPLKQTLFAVSLLQQTAEPLQPITFEMHHLDRIIELLTLIFDSYAKPYFANVEAAEKEKWIQDVSVAMPAFLHYFNSGTMASIEQVQARAQNEIAPFDSLLIEILGFGINDALRITNEISRVLSARLERFQDLMQAAMEARERLIASVDDGSVDPNAWHKAVDDAKALGPDIVDAHGSLFQFKTSEIDCDPDLLAKYLSTFSLSRGSNLAFTYLTERIPSSERPIFDLGDGSYICPFPNQIYSAIGTVFERTILESGERESFLTRRDYVLEKRAAELFRQALSDDAVLIEAAFETPDSQYEHDLIIIAGRTLLIVEAKASPPTEPFRDPSKAHTRIRRHFSSDRGIQKGFDQAERIRRRLVDEGTLTLFDQKGNQVATLDSRSFDDIFCVCVTRDDFGPLAVNLEVLLQKNADAPYPWVICDYDLEALVKGLRHLDAGEDELLRFIKGRIKLHGFAIGTDELEFAGFFLQHRGFSAIPRKAKTKMFMDPNYSDVFDQIYIAEQHGERISVNPSNPVLTDLKAALRARAPRASTTTPAGDRDTEVTRRKQRRKMERASRRRNRRRS